MSDLDQVDGFWSRFCWVPLPLTEMPPPSDGANYNLSALLQNLYQGLEALPPTFYWLDTESQTIWRDWHIFCERQKVDESNPALRAIYPKSKERTARIALVVHCINAVIEGRSPEPTISSATIDQSTKIN
jgi:hypothetical protein